MSSDDVGGRFVSGVVLTCVIALALILAHLLSQPPDCTPAMEGRVYTYPRTKYSSSSPVQVCRRGAWQDLQLPE